MKALTVIEPWASLIVHGYKKIETRSEGITWKNYRGTVLIHTSKNRSFVFELWTNPIFRKCLELSGIQSIWDFKFGCIIGEIRITDCFDTKYFIGISDTERSFGDYSPGRVGLVLKNPIVYDKPTPARGYQGLWNFDGKLN